VQGPTAAKQVVRAALSNAKLKLASDVLVLSHFYSGEVHYLKVYTNPNMN
jgi:hypothetical protein